MKWIKGQGLLFYASKSSFQGKADKYGNILILSNVTNYFSTLLVQQNQISPFLDFLIHVYFRQNIIPMFLPHLHLTQLTFVF